MDRYKKRYRKEKVKFEGRKGPFKTANFTFVGDLSHCICPAGKRMYANGNNITIGKVLQ